MFLHVISIYTMKRGRPKEVEGHDQKQRPYLKWEKLQKEEVEEDNEKIKQVQEIEYLGSMKTCDFRCDKDIKRRVAVGKEKFIEKKHFDELQISIETRKRFLKCYIWSILLYGSELWTISTEMKRKLEAIEMWCYRRIMKM